MIDGLNIGQSSSSQSPTLSLCIYLSIIHSFNFLYMLDLLLNVSRTYIQITNGYIPTGNSVLLLSLLLPFVNILTVIRGFVTESDNRLIMYLE